MTEITQADRDRASKAVLSAAADIADGNRGGIDWLAIHFADHRQIELTDAMIEAGNLAGAQFNGFEKSRYTEEQWFCAAQELRAVFNAMMGARMDTGG